MVERAVALAALRRRLEGRSFERETVVAVTDGGANGFLVEVRRAARLATHTLVVPADDESLATDLFVGEPADLDAGTWAEWAMRRVEEQLETGLTTWGVRIELEGGGTAIDATLEPAPSMRWWGVGDVPLTRIVPDPLEVERVRRAVRGRWLSPRSWPRRRWYAVAISEGLPETEPDPTPGWRLEEAGLDVGRGRRAVEAGHLAAWVEATAWDAMDVPVRWLGQAVAVRTEHAEATARLEHVEVADGSPPDVLAELVAGAAHAAADVGAHWFEVPDHVTVVADRGAVVSDREGWRRYDLTTLP